MVDLDASAEWSSRSLGMVEVQRRDHPNPTVILEKDGARIGFSINGGDATQDVAAILVFDIHRMKEELEADGVEIGNWRVDERDGQKFQVFFVAAPDGLCFYFHQPIRSRLTRLPRARREYIKQHRELIGVRDVALVFEVGTLLPWSAEMHVVSCDPSIPIHRLGFSDGQAEIPFPNGKLVLTHKEGDVTVKRR